MAMFRDCALQWCLKAKLFITDIMQGNVNQYPFNPEAGRHTGKRRTNLAINWRYPFQPGQAKLWLQHWASWRDGLWKNIFPPGGNLKMA